MTTLTKAQVARAEQLRAEKKSLREIAAVLGVAAATVKRALDQKKDGTTHSTLEKIRLQRLIRLQHQNAKLEGELKKMHAEWIPRADIEREVTQCNKMVKQQFLAIPYRECDRLAAETAPREIQRMLYEAILQTCNDLAYSREQPPQPDICPLCGRESRS